MQDDIISQFLRNEKELSKYRLSTLQRIKNPKASHRRMIEIEEGFLEFPFEIMPLKTLKDVQGAVETYRHSRNHFYQIYQKEIEELHSKEKEIELKKLDLHRKSLQDKISYLKKTFQDWSTVRVQEINLIQNEYFYDQFAAHESKRNQEEIGATLKRIGQFKIDQMIKAEPAPMAKKRARLQAMVLSVGYYLSSEFAQLMIDLRSDGRFVGPIEDLSLSPNLSLEDGFKTIKDFNNRIDCIFKNIDKNIFKYYNIAAQELYVCTHGTMGHNPNADKIRPLTDLFSIGTKFPLPIDTDGAIANYSTHPELTNILSSQKKIINNSIQRDAAQNIQNKVFGILLPVPHKGNERLTLLYTSVKTNSGVLLDDILSDSLSNIRAMVGDEVQYYKAILLAPLWKVVMEHWNPSYKNLFSLLLPIKAEWSASDMEDPETIEMINTSIRYSIAIDTTESCLLVPGTRTEDEFLCTLLPVARDKIAELQRDYLHEKFQKIWSV